MTVSKIVIQNFARTKGSPAEALEAANRQLCANNREEMFVTVWLGILDLASGTLTACNAGHENPVVKRAGKAFELLEDEHGLPLGNLEFSRYKNYELRLAPGDVLFLYTDGVPEAANAAQAFYGVDRMLLALNRRPDAEPRALLEALREDVASFVGDAPQFDDLTMMCLRYNGTGKRDRDTDAEHL